MKFKSYPEVVLDSGDDFFIDLLVERDRAIRDSGRRFFSPNDQPFLDNDRALLVGSRGEVAVAKYLGVSVNYDKAKVMDGDLDLGIEVKSTDIANGGLFVSKNTLDAYLERNEKTPICLARVEIPGWILARSAVDYPFMRTDPRHNAGYLVPASKLRPIDELKKRVEIVLHRAP
jgi:hypothetical protein